MKNTRTNTMNQTERRQQVALCASTYYNLHGVMPEPAALCSWLDESYLGDIARYLNSFRVPQLLCG